MLQSCLLSQELQEIGWLEQGSQNHPGLQGIYLGLSLKHPNKGKGPNPSIPASAGHQSSRGPGVSSPEHMGPPKET